MVDGERLAGLEKGAQAHAVADFHGVAFEVDPQLHDACTDPVRHEFVQQLLATPECHALRASTMLNDTASEIAAGAFAGRYADLHKEREKAAKAAETYGARWQRDYLVRTASASSLSYHPSRNNWGPLVVPLRHYFVLGDNRDNSLDSRYWGFVPDTLVRGQPLLVYYSYAPDTSESFPWLTQIRWTRIGSRIR